MKMSGRLFPDEYYNITTSNSNRRTSNWFCNRPLSPIPSVPNVIQDANISSSDESLSQSKNLTDSSGVDPGVREATNIVPENNLDVGEFPTNSGENPTEDIESNFTSEDDSNQDPDFVPESASSDSEDSQENILNENGSTFLNENSLTQEKTEGEPSKGKCYEQAVYPVENLGQYKNNGEKRKGNKKKDFCYFCESYVLNFARHILRNHSIEAEVQKIKCLSPKNKNRKKLLSNLRKKGNFLVSNTIRKPVRRPVTDVNILPCTNCMGFFSAKQLWRHRKACMGKSDKAHQANAQNFLLKDLRVDRRLREEVFPRMRPDEISLTAKTDDLICAFGTRYFKSHRDKHFINVTSRKMRELARLLIEMKKLKPSVKNLFEALRPENFEILVSATKIVSQFDNKNELFQSASTALNLGTSIKQCCQLAIIFVLKRKQVNSTLSAAEAEADLKTLIQLIESEWRFEISTQASNDLNMKKWNKITMVPLASDLKLLRDYLITKANSAAKELQSNCGNKNAYTTLLETVFCRILLLNRRRPGELQRLLLHTYEQCGDHSGNYEEFSEMITPSEKILLQRFKRIIIRGKRGRGVPVLFSSDIQEHIGMLLKYRANFVKTDNVYLFGNPNTVQPICGYKVITKYAKLAGTRNPQAITATKLRKHLATLTQVLNMSENDIEQLSAFMGHTVNVHRGSYRLPDDLFQTAKISKLLLLMEKGGAAQYKGKSLDDIDIDLDVDVNENDVDSEDEIQPFTDELKTVSDIPSLGNNQNSSDTVFRVSGNATNSLAEEKRVPNKISKRTLVPWTEEQKKTVRQFFAKHIKKCMPPKKHECLALKNENETLLANKDWVKIKVFVQNEYVKRYKN